MNTLKINKMLLVLLTAVSFLAFSCSDDKKTVAGLACKLTSVETGVVIIGAVGADKESANAGAFKTSETLWGDTALTNGGQTNVVGNCTVTSSTAAFTNNVIAFESTVADPTVKIKMTVDAAKITRGTTASADYKWNGTTAATSASGGTEAASKVLRTMGGTSDAPTLKASTWLFRGYRQTDAPDAATATKAKAVYYKITIDA